MGARRCLSSSAPVEMDFDLARSLVFFGCLLVAVVLHEISHGVVALWFGDDTARRAGRLTLNPVPHLDPFGSIILPAMGALTGLPVIGWAKPVPINVRRLRNPRRDMLLVSLAGPATNFVLAGVAALAARALWSGNVTSSFSLDATPVVFVLFFFAIINTALGTFNLLPIPPLDGSAIIEPFLPDRWRPAWYRFRPYGILVLFVLVFWTGLIDRVLNPFLETTARFVLG